MTNKPTHRVTAQDIIKINQYLTSTMVKNSEGFYVYNHDLSDKIIGERFDPPFTEQQIAKVRVQLGFRKPPYRSVMTRLLEAHNELVRRLNGLGHIGSYTDLLVEFNDNDKKSVTDKKE